MYYTIYETTNLFNNKKYIGAHATLNIEDDYLGSGKLIKRAIKKYGKENFKKVILFSFHSQDEMYSKEKCLITDDVIKSDEYYNLTNGGHGGGTDTVSVKDLDGNCFRVHRNNERFLNGALVGHNLGFNHSNDTKIKISETLKINKINCGKKNGNYGKVWCTSPDFKQTQKTEEELLKLIKIGWIRGRKFKTITCPHCGKTGSGQAMKRYHFDNCKFLNEE